VVSARQIPTTVPIIMVVKISNGDGNGKKYYLGFIFSKLYPASIVLQEYVV
jgi:hypothetical protein